MLTGDPELLYAGEPKASLAPVIGPASVLRLDGEEHRRHRQLLLPPFRGDRMSEYESVIEQVAAGQIARWPRSRRFAVLPSMREITLEVIMRVVFGVSDSEQMQRMVVPLRRLLDMGSAGWSVAFLLTTGRHGRWTPRARLATILQRIDELLYAEIAACRADPRGADRADIFSMLVEARDPDGRPLSDAELRDELMGLLLAGHETTASALAFTIELLSRTRARSPSFSTTSAPGKVRTWTP